MSAAKKIPAPTDSIIPFIFLGFSNGNACDCCGRWFSGAMVALYDATNAEDVQYSSACVARVLKIDPAEVARRATSAARSR